MENKIDINPLNKTAQRKILMNMLKDERRLFSANGSDSSHHRDHASGYVTAALLFGIIEAIEFSILWRWIYEVWNRGEVR